MRVERVSRRLAIPFATLALLALAVALPTLSTSPAAAATGPCQVTDQVNQWAGGFTSTITVTNNGPAVNTWNVSWTFPGDQQVTSAWNTQLTQTGAAVIAANEPYNGTLATGGSTSFGFQATFSGTNATPVDFAVNGQVCAGTPPPTTTTTTTTTGPPTGSGCTIAGTIFCDGFENQSGPTPSGRWSTVTPSCAGTGTAAIDNTSAHTGANSVLVTGAAGYCNHVFVDDLTDMATASPTWFVRLWVRHSTPLPTAHVTFLAMNDSADGNTDLRLGGQNGALMWNRQSDDATLPAQSPAGVAQSAVLPTNVWTCLEFSVDGNNGRLQTWLNGTAVAGLAEDGVPTQDLDGQWLAGSGANWRPRLTDLKLGWESYGVGADTFSFDDVALGTSRIGCG
ncbi:MAG TPA: cellulose-binding domain-containing protein [Pseudonocardiaceae bacterium]|jgi:hypothetical protein|nr:cellulose-binding domain-containing protein [Pseudonocardiaceae bacterium]